MTREDTPDLLESMFQPAPKPAARPQETAEQITRSRPTAQPRSVKPAPPVDPLIRCTHYIYRDTASRLHSAQGMLLMLTTLKKREVSNSNIVEAALRLAFDELERSGENSHLVAVLESMARENRQQ